MSIDARIASIAPHRVGLKLRLAAYPHSDGTMSIPGSRVLFIHKPTRRPVAGQKIWGDAGRCIIEAGYGGERIEYVREMAALYEVEQAHE